MSTALALVAEIEARGGRIDRVGDRLRVAPRRVLTPELRAELLRCKPELLAAVPSFAEAGESGYPLRVIVESVTPRSAPFDLAPGVRVIDPARCIAADLCLLEEAVARYSLVWAGRDADLAGAKVLGERIEDLLERLTACGAVIHVGVPS